MDELDARAIMVNWVTGEIRYATPIQAIELMKTWNNWHPAPVLVRDPWGVVQQVPIGSPLHYLAMRREQGWMEVDLSSMCPGCLKASMAAEMSRKFLSDLGIKYEE